MRGGKGNFVIVLVREADISADKYDLRTEEFTGDRKSSDCRTCGETLILVGEIGDHHKMRTRIKSSRKAKPYRA